MLKTISPCFEAAPFEAGVTGQLVQAIDVASYQPTNLAPFIQQFGVRHVIVKMYQRIEGENYRQHARMQIASAQANGCTVGGYLWLYANVSAEQQVADALALAEETGARLPLLWLDIEHYPTDHSMPNISQIHAAIAACERQGVMPGIYTGYYIWQELGFPRLPGVPLWSANYNGREDLNIPAYGDMLLVAHQFTSSPLDRSVIDLGFTGG
jgi:GH25 family lysozyme M1 (1,4-beta-N-acetylmuramidase)